MLSIMIVEDEPLVAQTLKHLVELNPLYRVTAVTEDSAGAYVAVEREKPDLALVDLHLAHGSTGFSIAAKLNEMGIPCLFTSGKAPIVPDDRPGARLPGQAVQRRGSGPRAQDRRGHDPRPRAPSPQPSRQSAPVRRGSARGRGPVPELLPTPARSQARRTLKDRASRVLRKLSFG